MLDVNGMRADHTAAARQRRAFAIVGHTASDLTKTTACAAADRVSSAVSGKGVGSMCNVAPDMPVFQ
ncbi:hypothetical protein SAMN04488526_2394 [Jannaschia helgolandensis]|uniref:Uncharacterized protein n=1 Tax=Jannaschia helgolandensis TaxID=188906 RepID=A0A1H7P292_9RHOB|nr:hypothetical protein SAMN04488526_2394 [Jannaschia helgolandensis]